jgi:predicted Fe-Mo cluster-binding NifX family protein
MSFNALPNGVNTLEGGSGIQAAKSLVDLGAQALLTGYIGPNAARVLSSAGLRTVSGLSGTVREAVEQYSKGSSIVARQSKARNRFDLENLSGDSQLGETTQDSPSGVETGQG